MEDHGGVRKAVRTVVIALLVVLLVVGGWYGWTYRRQIYRYATRWKGAPSSTVAYVPFDPPPAVHLAVAGDIGDSGSRLDATAAAMDGIEDFDEYDALLLLGDNVYPAGDPAELENTVRQPFAGVLDGPTELWAILGNHDVKDGNGPPQMEALGMPGRWWSTTIGDVLLVGLDSNEADDPEQLAFAERVLATADEPWKIVLIHHPPYSAGYQGSNMEVREIWTPIFERYGVQLVLSGHDHDYQRNVEMDGVTYVVTGGAAGTRRTAEEDFTEVSFSWHHFVDVAVFDDRLVLRAVNQDQRVADEVTIEQ
jgi:3',5'-cyclic AMP phosphodiesterase CpdA